MIVYRAEPKYIDVLWPHAEPLLEKAIRRTIGEVGLEDVKGWLKTDRQQLWLILDEEEQEIIVAFTTEIYVYPNHKHLRGHLWGAKRNTMKKWMDIWSEPVERFCKENGISHIETAGRDGWTRALRNKGYKKYYTVLVKELKDD
jgi:hypothetical protein|tara:strand:- start:356 stop:787 length:432 start_codon:yes stop_codon:yes gene_type:complete